jgi:Domain of unknown function (DUF6458)
MQVGTSILLIALGAVLRYAVTGTLSWIDVQTVGLILMIVGILGLIISLVYLWLWADRSRSPRDPYATGQAPQPPRERY